MGKLAKQVGRSPAVAITVGKAHPTTHHCKIFCESNFLRDHLTPW